MFGGGTWEGGSCEERNADFAGETRISLERGLEAGGLGGYSHHPMVVTTLALEVALCQSASSSIAQSGGKSWGEAMQGREWEGGMIFSRNRPLVNCKKLNLNETKLFETKFFLSSTR